MNKKKSIFDFDKKTLYNVLCISLGFTFLFLMLRNLGYVDNDYWFLKATGDEILSNGRVITTNPFFVTKGQPFDIQQWLWCILCSKISAFGNIGIFLIQIIQLIILEALMFTLFRTKPFKKYKAKKAEILPFPQVFLLVNFSAWLTYGYALSIRPECITTILLLVQILATEKFIRTSRKIWLALLPFCTLLEINLHSSLWFMHYCVLIPYFLPFADSKKRTEIKPFILPMILMTATMLVNPIGYKAILFIFEFFLRGTSKSVKQVEIYNIFAGPKPYALPVLYIINCYISCVRKKRVGKRLLSSEEAYIGGGLSILLFSALKSALFVPILAFYLFPYIVVLNCHLFIDKPKEKIMTDPKRGEAFSTAINKYGQKVLIGLTAAGLACSVVVGIRTAIKRIPLREDIYSSDIMESSTLQMKEISEFIEAEKGIDAKVFTHFNIGGFFEARGFRNLYVDARPESYAYPNTSAFGDTSVLKEYAMLTYDCASDNILIKLIGNKAITFSQVPEEEKAETVNESIERGKTYSDEEVTKILEHYGFDYLIVSEEMRLYYYLQNNNSYQEIVLNIQTDQMNYHLFKKIGGIYG